MRVVDAHATKHRDDLLVLRKLGDGLLAGQVADFVNRAHHFAVNGVMQYLFDEAAVNLEKIDREMFEIAE